MPINFQDFSNEIIDKSNDGDIDCDTVNDLAVKYGLLKEIQVSEPCCDSCQCVDMVGIDEFPIGCYRKTYL